MTNKFPYLPYFRCYELAWRIIMPVLGLHPRIKEGYNVRRRVDHLQRADVWIQAASAGEAYLANQIMANLSSSHSIRMLFTSNTPQGLDILHKGIACISATPSKTTAVASYFPFDRPSIMDAAVANVNPKVMVLLETEIWPGLIFALKKNKSRILIINGRLTVKSLHRFIKWKKFLHALSPDYILAISKSDARRFAALFGPDKVGLMPNIKFDRLNAFISVGENPLKGILPEGAKFVVLGSIRKEEESLAARIIQSLVCQFQEIVIGVFPRHMHRIPAWQDILTRGGMTWALRSRLPQETAEKGSIVLWDTFGELNNAYALADAAVVGGTFAPLGGQNFLEPLIFGIRPVIGPYWDNFAWVGEEIFTQGLVVQTSNWQAAVSEIIRQIHEPFSKNDIREAAAAYIQNRKGGTEIACRLIQKQLHME